VTRKSIASNIEQVLYDRIINSKTLYEKKIGIKLSKSRFIEICIEKGLEKIEENLKKEN